MRNAAPVDCAPSILPPQANSDTEETLQTGPNTGQLNPALHTYLGALDDLAGAPSLLPAGFRCRIPLLQLDAVLMPGATLPLRLVSAAEIRFVERALEAPEPISRLIAVVFWGSSREPLPETGCTAEIQQMQRQRSENGSLSLNCLARGRQRLKIKLDQAALQDLGRCQVEILPEAGNGLMPRELRDDVGHWPLRALRPFNTGLLAETARSLFHQFAPEVQEYKGSPLELSFWLAMNLPLQHATRQSLLEAPTAAARLSQLIESINSLHSISCSCCSVPIAEAKDVISMSEEGIGSVYVNAHGHVHDMITLRNARHMSSLHDEEPSTENSWFPGYGWTIVYCNSCRQHLGWLFTATFPDSEPQQFWGLRRTSIHEFVETSEGSDFSDEDDEDFQVTRPRRRDADFRVMRARVRDMQHTVEVMAEDPYDILFHVMSGRMTDR